jgi:hypothetical protein
MFLHQRNLKKMIYVDEDIKKIEQNEAEVFAALKSLTQDAVYCNLCKQFLLVTQVKLKIRIG